MRHKHHSKSLRRPKSTSKENSPLQNVLPFERPAPPERRMAEVLMFPSPSPVNAATRAKSHTYKPGPRVITMCLRVQYKKPFPPEAA
jgi:hypothetical protein